MAKDEVNMNELKENFEAQWKGFEEFKSKIDEQTKELRKGFDDVVRREEIDRINDAIEKKQEVMDEAIAKMKRMATNLETSGGDHAELDAKAAAWAAMNAKRNDKPAPTDFKHEQMIEYKKAFRNFLRKDDRGLSGDELKALSVGRDPDGGYLVSPDESGRMVNRIYETSPVRQYANIQVISTDALEGMFDLDEASTGWVNETEARSETNTPQLDKWRIPVHEQYAKPQITQKLVDDAAIDPEAWLAMKVADKMSRTENAAFASGDGIGKPRGFLTYPDWTTAGTPELNAIERFDSGVDGGFAAAPNGGDVLLDALYGLKQQYRNNAVWFMNRLTTKEVRKLKDSDGSMIWQPGLQAGQPSSLLGYSVAAFEDMPDLATDSLSIMVGDLNAAYQIVDRQGIRVLVDPYSNKPYIQYYTTKRVGGDVIDFEAIKLIEFTA